MPTKMLDKSAIFVKLLKYLVTYAKLMVQRKQQIEALLNDLGSLKRLMADRGAHGRKNVHMITPAQWSALLMIEQGEVHSVKDLAGALGVSSSAATQLIDGLVKNGCVRRSVKEEDRRAVSIALTKPMHAQIMRKRQQTITKLIALFESLTDAEFRQYCALTAKIVRTARGKGAIS